MIPLSYIIFSYFISWLMIIQISKKLSPDGFELFIWLLSPMTWPVTTFMFFISTGYFTKFSRWLFRAKP